MSKEFSIVPDTYCKSLLSVSYLKIRMLFFWENISASKQLKGTDQSHSFLFSLNSVSCFGKVSLTLGIYDTW